MNRTTLIFVLVAIVFLGYRDVRARCRRAPRLRPWFIGGSIATLGVAGVLVPWVLSDLKPPWSESPAGILVYLGKGMLVGVPGLVALGALAGAIGSGWPRRSDLGV